MHSGIAQFTRSKSQRTEHNVQGNGDAFYICGSQLPCRGVSYPLAAGCESSSRICGSRPSSASSIAALATKPSALFTLVA